MMLAITCCTHVFPLLLFVTCCSTLEVQPFPSNVVRGINYYFGDNSSTSAPSTLQSVQYKAAAIGAKLLAISFQICQATATSNYVFRDPAITPSNESLTTLINFARQQGMSSFLKPLIEQNSSDSSFAMADVNPSNVTLWFESYTAVMLQFAELSESLGGAVTMICVGLELEKVSPYTSQWITLIQKIRAVYSGKLSYCSDTLSGETEAIGFWNSLDYVGLDIYVPLVNPLDPNANLQPSLASMQSEFTYIWDVGFYDWYSNSSLFGVVPLFITETGYPSSNGGLQTPYMIPSASNGGCTGKYAENQTAQSAALEVLSLQLPQYMVTSDLLGFVYFNLDDSSNSWYQNKTNGTFACSWSPVDKTGYAVLSEMFAAVPSSNDSSELTSADIAIIASTCSFVGVLCIIGLWFSWDKLRKKCSLPAAQQEDHL